MAANTPSSAMSAHSSSDRVYLFQLDGWRGISILCVLAAHLLPLGPSAWQLNGMAGLMGMSLFFTLSGYLITSFLLERPEIRSFLIRRLFRIIPLAWLFLVVVLLVHRETWDVYLSHFFFYVNYSHDARDYTSHFWSLCVEMHFYLFVAALVMLGGKRALYLLPLVCLGVTAWRVGTATPVSIVTHLRVDEILAGATLALIHTHRFSARANWLMCRVAPWVWLIGFVIVCHQASGWLMYLRPYLGALLVGATLFQADHWMVRPLRARSLKYLATISYALYVIHGPLRTGWFAEGSSLERYLIKRPITFALTFLLAHFSTFHWEARWIEWGRRLTRSRRPAPMPVVPEVVPTSTG